MATQKQQTTNYKMYFWCVFFAFLVLLWVWGYLKLSDMYTEYNISNLQEEIDVKKAELAGFSDKPGYNKLQYVQEMEKTNLMMPWSDHINAIMAIFGDLLDVDRSDTFNIAFSNFEISLEEIRLDGYVTNLRILYQWANSKKWLIEQFEELDFLNNISIKTYEKSEWELWYQFTLTANVINNGK